MLWVGIGAFVLIFVFIIPYLTEHSKDRPKTEIKSTPKKVVSSDLNPKMKASIQKYVGDWIKTKRFIKFGFWDGSSLVQIFFELDVRYLGNNPKIEAEQFSDNVALQAVKIFKHDFCIHTYYGDHNKLSMSCEYFRD